jgi:tetratricopeptide (TPR) repeat protein
MNVNPWRLWTLDGDGNFPNETLKAKEVLEEGLEEHPKDLGLLHLYIHLMELSASPELAKPAADLLREIAPDQGHLLHMPSHIDMWLGHYEAAIASNVAAIAADQRYVLQTGHTKDFYKMYRLHNIHFCCWAAMFDGQYGLAKQHALMLQDELTPDLVQDMPGAQILEAFYSVLWHVFIRFGKWDEILSADLPKDQNLYPVSLATAHYARGITFASLGRIEEAEAEQKAFMDALEHPLMAERMMINNFVLKDGEGTLKVGIHMLEGEILYRKGQFENAFKHLEKAVTVSDNLVYDEPWGWMIPPRHALGALLLEQGRVQDAWEVYQTDLGQYRNNLWSLSGQLECLLADPSFRSNQQEIERHIRSSLHLATARSDQVVRASCFCSEKAGAAPIQSLCCSSSGLTPSNL